MQRYTQSLNGLWKYSINGVPQGTVAIPSSSLCAGNSEYSLVFDAHTEPYAELCFEGITYSGEAVLNGHSLGQMVPYSRYCYDVTNLLKPADNHLSVKIRDLGLGFGPSEGWENYSGIIRGVSMNYMNAVHITDVIWRTSFEEEFRKANCDVFVSVSGNSQALVTVQLKDHYGDLIASASGMVSQKETVLKMSVHKPILWSPDHPYLYTLCVSTGDDMVVQKVGFKDFKVEGQRFLLNGVPIFLRGVCRHDMWGDQGYTLTYDQMEKDLRLIKGIGCNFVRLVHYPHHPHIVELADEIGLLVSEEPGLWWADMENKEVTDAALTVLEKVVRRDRNRVSVCFWLSFNECFVTLDYVKASGKLCHTLDPTRPVSGAHANDLWRAKEYFPQGYDFYTWHPYTFNYQDFALKASELHDKPLVFTEWGGWFVYENQTLFEKELRTMIEAWEEPDGGNVVAGCSYWEWADMYEFGRGGDACTDGVLCEGLVDKNRNPHKNLEIFSSVWRSMGLKKDSQSGIKLFPVPIVEKEFSPVDLTISVDAGQQAERFAAMIEKSTPVEGFFAHKKTRKLTTGPVLVKDLDRIGNLPLAGPNARPVLIDSSSDIKIHVDGSGEALYFLGNVCIPWGYPLYGEHGTTDAFYKICYSDGSFQIIPLRNGIELTTALGQHGPSRIRPVAPGVDLAIEYHYDLNWENYIVNIFKCSVDRGKKIHHIDIHVCNENCILLLYAITLAKTQ